jgi:hypothetical protein
MKSLIIGIAVLFAGIVTITTSRDSGSVATAMADSTVSAPQTDQGKAVALPQQSTFGENDAVPMATLGWALQYSWCSTSIDSRTKRCPSGASCSTAGEWCVRTLAGTCGITGLHYSYYKCVAK